MEENNNYPAGWYPDSQGVTRWWDGNQWTENVQQKENFWSRLKGWQKGLIIAFGAFIFIGIITPSSEDTTPEPEPEVAAVVEEVEEEEDTRDEEIARLEAELAAEQEERERLEAEDRETRREEARQRNEERRAEREAERQAEEEVKEEARPYRDTFEWRILEQTWAQQSQEDKNNICLVWIVDPDYVFEAFDVPDEILKAFFDEKCAVGT